MEATVDVIKEVLQAERRIRRRIRETPLEYSYHLSEVASCNVYLKLENLQPTGSFKVRGALNKLLALTQEQRDRGVVTASSGNHGAAVAWVLSTLDAHGVVFVPEDASPTKVEAIQRFGAEVRRHALDVAITEEFARSYAETNRLEYISPYNDLHVIGGQGTIAVELARQLDQADALFVSVGGGGLISGVASYAKSAYDDVKVFGCLPQNSAVMAASVKAGRILKMESLPTLSDGTAGGIESGAITFDLCRKLVDDFILVSEEEIADAMRLFMASHHMMIEGAAGVAIASFLKTKEQFRDKNVVIVICGANISMDTLKTIL